MKRVESFKEYLGGRFMSPADLQGKEWTLTIAETGLEEVPDFDHPGQVVEVPAIRFLGAKKLLRVNNSNNEVLENAFGYAQDAWIGKRVTLWPDMSVKFKGYVGTIRIRIDPAAQVGAGKVAGNGNAYAAASQPAAQPATDPQIRTQPEQRTPMERELDDEIPF